METGLGEEAGRPRRHRAGCEFPKNVREKKQPTNDPDDVQPVGEIEIAGLNPEVISRWPHRPTPL